MAAIRQLKYSFMNLHKKDALLGFYRTRCHWYCDPLAAVREMVELLGGMEGAGLFKGL